MPARSKTAPPDPETLPAVFPVLTASKVLGIGKNQTYTMIERGTYPVRVRKLSGKWRVTRYDLLRYLGAPASGQATAGGAA
jgi:Helix-turn-helix domain